MTLPQEGRKIVKQVSSSFSTYYVAESDASTLAD